MTISLYKVFLENSYSAGQKSTCSYRIQRFVTVFTKACQLNPVPTFPLHFSKTHFNIILPSTTRSLKRFFPLLFSSQTLYAFLISPMCVHVLTTSSLFQPFQDLCWQGPTIVEFVLQFNAEVGQS
jgi:hypothetical protein